MPLYFMLFEAGRFQQVSAALAACWSAQSFEPCRSLCRDLEEASRSFIERYNLGADDLLLAKDPGEIPLDRDLWRTLAGELLLIAADEVPEIATAADVLTCLLAPERYREGAAARERHAPIEQAYFGTRDLVFAATYYRPDHAGWNDRGDVARLAQYLAAVDPSLWQISDLEELRDIDSEDRTDELEYARQCFDALRELYRRADERGQLVVCEEI